MKFLLALGSLFLISHLAVADTVSKDGKGIVTIYDGETGSIQIMGDTAEMLYTNMSGVAEEYNNSPELDGVSYTIPVKRGKGLTCSRPISMGIIEGKTRVKLDGNGEPLRAWQCIVVISDVKQGLLRAN